MLRTAGGREGVAGRCGSEEEKLDGAQDPKSVHDLDHHGGRPGKWASRKGYSCVALQNKDTFVGGQKQSKDAFCPAIV